jgi:protein-S-isoprenylcysteine O-methyltransferase Ste14
MIVYIKRHERYVLSFLDTVQTRAMLTELLEYHDKQILWMQHERLAHLVTMMFVCLFFLLTFGFCMMNFSVPSFLLTLLLLFLTLAYILHYFRLENSLQRWYDLSNRIRGRLMDLP